MILIEKLSDSDSEMLTVPKFENFENILLKQNSVSLQLKPERLNCLKPLLRIEQ